MPRHTLTEEHPIPEAQCLIERMVERDNMVKALNRVKQNKGAAGISVKVSAYYPGRSHVMPQCYRCCEATGCDMRSQPRA